MSGITAASCFIGVLVMSTATLQAGRAQESLRVGDPFPELKGRSLTGRDAVLPQAASGRVTLIAIGFTYQSRFPVEAWAAHKDDAYLIAVDRSGVVRWLHHGGFDPSQADDLHGLLTSLSDRAPAAADDRLASRNVEP
jgi:hypothetical protein